MIIELLYLRKSRKDLNQCGSVSTQGSKKRIQKQKYRILSSDADKNHITISLSYSYTIHIYIHDVYVLLKLLLLNWINTSCLQNAACTLEPHSIPLFLGKLKYHQKLYFCSNNYKPCLQIIFFCYKYFHVISYFKQISCFRKVT